MFRMKKPLVWGVFFLLVGTVVGLILSAHLGMTTSGIALNERKASSAGEETPASNPGLLQLQNTGRAFSAVAKEVIPTVVSISSTKKVKRSSREAPFEPFRHFMPEEFWKRFDVPEEFEQDGLGSGCIISKDGYILTNTHVVQGADEIAVTLTDQRKFAAEVIGADTLTEVALVKIKGDNLPVARLGDSRKLEIGEWVLAIGNPLQLTSTVTAGIVSALGRSTGGLLPQGFGIENFIQTDAVINPGNSGGPLVNLNGEVIGINTAIQTGTGYYVGYGFAIPMNMAKRAMDDFIKHGRVVRAYLGIQMQNVNEELAEALNLSKPVGVFVPEVVEGSPAERAGVKEKDVILKVDDQEVNRPNQVQALIFEKRPGDKITLTLIRQGREKQLDVVLGEREGGQVRLASTTRKRPSSQAEALGITVQELTDELAEELRYRNDEGVVVSDVERYSPASRVGIRRGDLIMEIDNKPVTSVRDFAEITAGLQQGRSYLFYINQGGQKRFVAVAMPKK
ncbi:MAG: DegQ family serine endoprotease [Candidatus Latescibacteria bacterium]|nr:DegQ family serine endoprotease [Candidatus Latescibacterota bacterium]